nr:hypothetical protein [Moellerella wisconsensis]
MGGTKILAALISRDNQLTQHTQITIPASVSPTQLYEVLVVITTPLQADASSITRASIGYCG